MPNFKAIEVKAIEAWNALQGFRQERARCKRFVFGDQWSEADQGKGASRGEILAQYGQQPLTNNILRRIVRNVTGIYRAQYKVPPAAKAEYGDKAAEVSKLRLRLFHANRMEELLPRLLEEYLISGLAAVKIRDGDEVPDSPAGVQRRVIPVTPDNFFFHSDGYDPRGWDIDMIGEVHNLSLSSLMAAFCTTAADLATVVRVYGHSPSGACRVVEVWRRHTDLSAIVHDHKAAKARIIGMEELLKAEEDSGVGAGADIKVALKSSWICSWHAADGTLLREDPPQKSHPYVVKAYPFLDGEIHSYIHDLIEQQKYVNHLITLYDFIMRSSAKGVLLIPDETIPERIPVEEIAAAWTQFNGVIPYRAVPGVPAPSQISTNSTNIGITELLQVQMKMLEDISGVSPTLQGKIETANPSASLFARQNEAAVTSLLDLLRSFDAFTADIARRLA